ncbi:hypothetical protein HY358_01165 [Candidatus Roizmanbacteria bacterium]|nr:hypothetical protein [Candidatus Roizmanbacteria bacterium]
MKGIIWNCKKVKWKYARNEKIFAEKCILLYICCEQGDGKKQMKETARRIIQLNKKRYLRETLVIFPYAHLSNHILEQSQAKELIDGLVERLARKNQLKILTMGFNQSKEVLIHLLPHNADVTYFSY